MVCEDGRIYLVDFGMSKYDSVSNGIKTSNQVELGNRFLRLPEYAAGHHGYDESSDVTQVVGIFFFLITGLSPRILLDTEGKLPHQRLDLEAFINANLINQIRRIFDIGFQNNKLKRFNSVAELVEKLDELNNLMNGNKVDSENSEINEIMDFFKSDYLKEIENREVLMKRINDAYLGQISQLASSLSLACAGSEICGDDRLSYTSNFVLLKQGTSSPQTGYTHIAFLDEL